MTRIYQVGDSVTLQATFTSLAGVDTDPTAISLKVQTPAGVTTTYTYAGGQITKSATGVFQYALDVTTAGRWWYKWFGAGTVQAASEDTWLEVQETRF